MFPTLYLPSANDPYIEDVTLLMHGHGENDSTTIVDSSLYAHPVTRFGTPVIKTAPSKFGRGCMYFDGLGDYLTMPDSEAWNFGNGDFTIECWFNAIQFDHYVAGLKYPNLFGQRVNSNNNEAFYCYVSANAYPTLSTVFTYRKVSPSVTVGPGFNYNYPENVWHHLAWCRSTTTLRGYVNGVVQETYNCGTDSINDSSTAFYIGALPGSIWETYWKGYIEDLRITRGIARYGASSFAVPTAPYPNP